MIIHGPLLSTLSVAFIAVAAVLIVSFLNWRTVDPAETEAIAKSCMAQGMVARLDVEKGHILVYCQTKENAGGYERKK